MRKPALFVRFLLDYTSIGACLIVKAPRSVSCDQLNLLPVSVALVMILLRLSCMPSCCDYPVSAGPHSPASAKWLPLEV